MKTLILKSVAVLLPITGFAQLPDCLALQTQMDLNDCASRAYGSADALLNHTWKISIRDATIAISTKKLAISPTRICCAQRSALESNTATKRVWPKAPSHGVGQSSRSLNTSVLSA
ncbi:DUF1311 domain-containing protein [Ascidiaceihabitans sp.]|nr:DUF1311 domain-containing protein [Ascidiaceihabitans sp.]